MKKIVSLPSKNMQGSVAEWLGTGLQNREQRFESARNLKKMKSFGYYFQNFFIEKHNLIVFLKDCADCGNNFLIKKNIFGT